jgi:hypothetical protein
MKGTVTTDSGERLTLVKPKALGLAPCPGEAHTNPYIDNCLLCAPRWGQSTTYELLTPEACVPGVVVSVNDGHPEAFEAAERLGVVRMIHITKRTRSCTTSFYGWVRT